MNQHDLQSLSSLRFKYSYEDYSKSYLHLYEQERQRIANSLSGEHYKIYHAGSTAIPGVGGKGVIDIFISTSPANLGSISKILVQLGYEFRESGGSPDRQFHQTEINGRRYHIHLTSFNNPELIQALAFRDYLKTHKRLAYEYSEIKKHASAEARKMTDKDAMKNTYALLKQPVIDKILEKLIGYLKKHKRDYVNL